MPTQPPTTESIARTMSGTVITQGDSCGSPGAWWWVWFSSFSSGVVRPPHVVVCVRVRLVGLAARVRLSEALAAPESQNHQARHVDGGQEGRDDADDPQEFADARRGGGVCAPGLS